MDDLQLPTVPCTMPLEITPVDNRPISDVFITHKTLPVTLCVGLFYTKDLVLFVISLPANPIILGFLWLQTHDLQAAKDTAWTTTSTYHVSQPQWRALDSQLPSGYTRSRSKLVAWQHAVTILTKC